MSFDPAVLPAFREQVPKGGGVISMSDSIIQTTIMDFGIQAVGWSSFHSVPTGIQTAIVNIHGVDYVVDQGLRQFRPVDNPARIIPFESDLGLCMCDETVTFTCPVCGHKAVYPVLLAADEVYCLECHAVFIGTICPR